MKIYFNIFKVAGSGINYDLNSDEPTNGDVSIAFSLNGRITNVRDMLLSENAVMAIGPKANSALQEKGVYTSKSEPGEYKFQLIDLQPNSKLL